MKNENMNIPELIEGLQIAMKYNPEGVGATHDEIHIFPTDEMSEEDISKMEVLGFTQNGGYSKDENWIFYT
jgi:hypothetical protein